MATAGATKTKNLDFIKPLPKTVDLTTAFRAVSVATEAVISQRETAAEIEGRIDEGFYLVRCLMRALRRARTIRILYKGNSYLALNNYIDELSSCHARAARYLSQLQDSWKHQVLVVLPAVEKFNRNAQRTLNDSAQFVLMDVPPSPKVIQPAPRVRKRPGRPRLKKQTKPSKKATRSRTNSTVAKRKTRNRSVAKRMEQMPQISPPLLTEETETELLQQANLPLPLHETEKLPQEQPVHQMVPEDGDDGLSFLPPVDPSFNYQNVQIPPPVQGQSMEFGVLQPVFNADNQPAPFVTEGSEYDPLGISNAPPVDFGEFLVNNTDNSNHATENAGGLLANHSGDSAIVPSANELDQLIHLMPLETPQVDPVVDATAAAATSEVQVHVEHVGDNEQPEIPTDQGEKEPDDVAKELDLLLAEAPAQLDIDSMLGASTQFELPDFESNPGELNLSEGGLFESQKEPSPQTPDSIFNSPKGSEPETMRGNFDDRGVFDNEEEGLSPRIFDEGYGANNEMTSGLFQDHDWEDMLPEGMIRAREYERFRETPDSPSMFEVFREPSPRVKEELLPAQLWETDLPEYKMNVKEEYSLLDYGYYEPLGGVKVKEEPVLETLYDGYYEPSRSKVKEEPVLETLDDGHYEPSRRVKVNEEPILETLDDGYYEPQRRNKLKQEPVLESLLESYYEFDEHDVRQAWRAPKKINGTNKNIELSFAQMRNNLLSPRNDSSPKKAKKEKYIPVGSYDIPRKRGNGKKKTNEDSSDVPKAAPMKENNCRKKHEISHEVREMPRMRTRRMAREEKAANIHDVGPERTVARKKAPAKRKSKAEKKKAEPVPSSANRLYPKNNQVRFHYTPKPSRHDKAYAPPASSTPKTTVATEPVKPSANRLYPKNNQVRFKYEPKPSRHDKAYNPVAAQRNVGKDKSKAIPPSSTIATQKRVPKSGAQEIVDRLYRKPEAKPPRRSARIFAKQTVAECETPDRRPLHEVAAQAKKRKPRPRK